MTDRLGEFQSGKVFGDYMLTRVLGSGGVGVVYEARNRALDRLEAIKLLRLFDTNLEARFLQEARLAASLNHPSIVKIFRFGVHENHPFIAMELIEGKNAEEHRLDHPSIRDQTWCRFMTDIASALDHAHVRGVVHRDVKPANTVIGKYGSVLTDFGISRSLIEPSQTVTGQLVGTLAYISPELINGEAAGPRSDQYSLACTCFHMLVGRPPFQGDMVSLFGQHLTAAPPDIRRFRPDLGRGVAEVLERALSKDPQRRFTTCAEFAAELTAATALPPLPQTRAGLSMTRAGHAPQPAPQHPPAVPPPANASIVEVVDYSDFDGAESTLIAPWVAGVSVLLVVCLAVLLLL